MKKLVTALILAGLVGCSEDSANQTLSQPPAQAEIAPEPVIVDHYYAMKDGFEYGYEQVISQNEQEAGQAASTLMMFKYYGQKDGVYQLMSKQNDEVISVLECTNPCAYIKIMTRSKTLGHLNTQHLKAVEGTIAWSAMTDAINGKLEQFVGERDGNKYTVWLDEKKGFKKTPLDAQ